MFGAICANRPVQTNLVPLTPTQFVFTIAPFPPFTHLVVFLLPGQALPPGTAAGVYIRFPPSAANVGRALINGQGTGYGAGGAARDGTRAAAGEFKFLGAIGNEKQSAVFRVKGLEAGVVGGHEAPMGGAAPMATDDAGEVVDEDAMVDEEGGVSPSDPAAGASSATAATGEEDNITIGISIEPTEIIAAQLASLKPTSTSSSSPPPPSKPQPQPQSPPIAQDTSTALVVAPGPSTSQMPSQRMPVKVLAQRIIQNAFNFLASFTTGRSGEEVVPLRSFQDWWAKFEKRLERDPGFLEREEG